MLSTIERPSAQDIEGATPESGEDVAIWESRRLTNASTKDAEVNHSIQTVCVDRDDGAKAVAMSAVNSRPRVTGENYDCAAQGWDDLWKRSPFSLASWAGPPSVDPIAAEAEEKAPSDDEGGRKGGRGVLALPSAVAQLGDSTAPTGLAPVKQQLAAAEEDDESAHVLYRRFLQKLGQLMQASASSVDPSQTMIDLGVDAPVAADIRSWFLKEVRIDKPAAKVRRGGSCAGLCENAIIELPVVSNSQPDDHADATALGNPDSSDIDWGVEVALSRQALAVQYDPKPRTEKVEVLLTGSTGFLGGAILRALAEDDRVTKVHCTGVRRKGLSDRKLAVESEKISIYYGDLWMPQLGLSEEDFRSLAEKVDVIIHNGADVSFLKSYGTLRKPNVQSTKDLVVMALRHRIPFHFVSTGGIAHLTGLERLDELSLEGFPPPADGSDGYVASKWASERYLENASKQLGLPVWIHRPTSITGEGAPSMDVMQNVLASCIATKSLPLVEEEGWKAKFDFIHVDEVARRIVWHAFERHGDNNDDGCTPLIGAGNHLSFVHLCNDKKLTWAELKEKLETENGFTLEPLPLDEWLERAVDAGLSELVAATFEEVTRIDADDAVVFTELGRARRAYD